MNRFLDKVVLVTGGAGGIGSAICHVMAEEGALVICLDINKTQGQKTVQAIQEKGGRADYCMHDAGEDKSWTDVVAQIMDKYGRIDVLVNNAYKAQGGRLVDLEYEHWRDNFTVTLDGAYWGMRRVLPHMKDGSAIVNIGSIVARLGMPENVGYGAAKGALRSLTQSVAIDYARQNIRVNAIAPGFVQTDALEILRGYLSERHGGDPLQQALERIPLGRVADPVNIAKTVAFLASSDASYITGQEIVADGGYLLQ